MAGLRRAVLLTTGLTASLALLLAVAWTGGLYGMAAAVVMAAMVVVGTIIGMLAGEMVSRRDRQ